MNKLFAFLFFLVFAVSAQAQEPILSNHARIPGAQNAAPDVQLFFQDYVVKPDSGGKYFITGMIPYKSKLYKAFIKVRKNVQVDSSGAPNGTITFWASPQSYKTNVDSLRVVSEKTTLDTAGTSDKPMIISGLIDSSAYRWSRFGLTYGVTKTYGPDTVNNGPDSIFVSLILKLLDN